jgi:hypothetical protein
VFTVGWHGSPIKSLFFKIYWWNVPSNSGHIVLQTLLVNHAIQQWTHYSSNIIGEPCHPTVNTLFFKLYWWTMPSNSEHIILQTLLVNCAIQQWTHCSSNFIGETCHPTVHTLFFKRYWWTVPSNSQHSILQTLLGWMARFTNKVWKIMCSLLHAAVHQ